MSTPTGMPNYPEGEVFADIAAAHVREEMTLTVLRTPAT